MDQLAAELEDARRFVRRAGRRVLFHIYVAVVGAERTRQREVAHEVQAVVGDGRHVRGLEAYERLQHVETGRDAGRLDLVEHLLHRFNAVLVLRTNLVRSHASVAVAAEDAGIVQ